MRFNVRKTLGLEDDATSNVDEAIANAAAEANPNPETLDDLREAAITSREENTRAREEQAQQAADEAEPDVSNETDVEEVASDSDDTEANAEVPTEEEEKEKSKEIDDTLESVDEGIVAAEALCELYNGATVSTESDDNKAYMALAGNHVNFIYKTLGVAQESMSENTEWTKPACEDFFTGVKEKVAKMIEIIKKIFAHIVGTIKSFFFGSANKSIKLRKDAEELVELFNKTIKHSTFDNNLSVVFSNTTASYALTNDYSNDVVEVVERTIKHTDAFIMAIGTKVSNSLINAVKSAEDVVEKDYLFSKLFIFDKSTVGQFFASVGTAETGTHGKDQVMAGDAVFVASIPNSSKDSSYEQDLASSYIRLEKLVRTRDMGELQLPVANDIIRLVKALDTTIGQIEAVESTVKAFRPHLQKLEQLGKYAEAKAASMTRAGSTQTDILDMLRKVTQLNKVVVRLYVTPLVEVSSYLLKMGNSIKAITQEAIIRRTTSV